MFKAKKGLIIGGIAVLIVLLVFVTCTATVETGYTGIVTTFGKVEDVTLEAGLHFKSPFQRIIAMDNREQKTSFTTEAFSSDIQQVNIIGSKGVFSKYSAENLVANREKLSQDIRDGLDKELTDYGINVISLSIENLDFTDAFTDAVEAKQVAAQRKLQAEIEQAQMTMETQQQAERRRIDAEAAANVAKINADADAYATKVRSEAEAEANKKIAESLTENLIRFNEIKNWDGKLPTYMAGEGSTTVPVLQFGSEEKTAEGE